MPGNIIEAEVVSEDEEHMGLAVVLGLPVLVVVMAAPGPTQGQHQGQDLGPRTLTRDDTRVTVAL